MTVSVSLTSCAPQAKELELMQDGKTPSGDDFTKEVPDLKNDQVRCVLQQTEDQNSCLEMEGRKDNASSEEIKSSGVPAVPAVPALPALPALPLKENGKAAHREETPENNQECVTTNNTEIGRAHV